MGVVTPWDEWRHPNGDFRLWLHTWYWLYDSAHECDTHSVYLPLPWVFQEQPSGEFLKAICSLGYADKIPGWSAADFRLSTEGYDDITAIYGVVLPRFPAGALNMWISERRHRHATSQDFRAWLDSNHKLF